MYIYSHIIYNRGIQLSVDTLYSLYIQYAPSLQIGELIFGIYLSSHPLSVLLTWFMLNTSQLSLNFCYNIYNQLQLLLYYLLIYYTSKQCTRCSQLFLFTSYKFKKNQNIKLKYKYINIKSYEIIIYSITNSLILTMENLYLFIKSNCTSMDNHSFNNKFTNSDFCLNIYLQNKEMIITHKTYIME